MKALQKCRHPRVVRYIDRAFETVKSSVHFYLIMEYMSEVRGACLVTSGEETVWLLLTVFLHAHKGRLFCCLESEFAELLVTNCITMSH